MNINPYGFNLDEIRRRREQIIAAAKAPAGHESRAETLVADQLRQSNEMREKMLKKLRDMNMM